MAPFVRHLILQVDVDDYPVLEIKLISNANFDLIGIGEGSLNHPIGFVKEIDRYDLIMCLAMMLQRISSGVPFVKYCILWLSAHYGKPSLFAYALDCFE